MDFVLFQDFVEIKSNLHEKLSKNYGIACRTAFIQNEDRKKYYLSIGTSSRIPIYPEMTIYPLLGCKMNYNHNNNENNNENNKNNDTHDNVNDNNKYNNDDNEKSESNVITLSFNRKSSDIEQYISIRFSSRDIFLLWHKGIRESLGGLKLTKALDYKEKQNKTNQTCNYNLLNLIRIEKALHNVSASLLLPPTHDHFTKVKTILELRVSIDEVLCCLKYKNIPISFENLATVVKNGEKFDELKNDFHFQSVQKIVGHGPLVTPEDIKQICNVVTDLKPPMGTEFKSLKTSRKQGDKLKNRSSKSSISSSIPAVVASSPVSRNNKKNLMADKLKTLSSSSLTKEQQELKSKFPTLSTPTSISASNSTLRRREHRKKQSQVTSNLHHLSSSSLCLIVVLALALGSMIPRVTDNLPISSSSQSNSFSSLTPTQEEIGFDPDMRLGDLLTQSLKDPASLFRSPLQSSDEKQQKQKQAHIYHEYPFKAPDAMPSKKKLESQGGSPQGGSQLESQGGSSQGGSQIIRWFSHRIRLLLMQLIQRFLYGWK